MMMATGKIQMVGKKKEIAVIVKLRILKKPNQTAMHKCIQVSLIYTESCVPRTKQIQCMQRQVSKVMGDTIPSQCQSSYFDRFCTLSSFMHILITF